MDRFLQLDTCSFQFKFHIKLQLQSRTKLTVLTIFKCPIQQLCVHPVLQQVSGTSHLTKLKLRQLIKQ